MMKSLFGSKKGMLVGYARVSREDQKLQPQIDALVDYGVDSRHIFHDVLTGANCRREGLSSLLSYVSAGDTIVVWKLDRLGRSLKDLVYVIENLKERSINFVSITEGIDTSTSTGMMTFHIFGSMAEFERELIRERTLAGLESARRRGKFGGRRFSLDNEKREVLFELLKSGKTQTEAARVLSISRATVHRELKRKELIDTSSD